jgi:hypothetical protein
MVAAAQVRDSDLGNRVKEDAIPAVLAQLAQHGVSVRWRDGKAVFKAAAAPPADIVALINARKAEVSAFLHPEAVQHRLHAETDVLQAERPPDVSDDRWETALTGLRAFIAAGHGDEALRLGWQRDELYRVPQLWSQIHICGCALLIGDHEVVGITSSEIRIKAASGGTLAFYRKPVVDYRVAYEAQLQAICGNYPGDSEEPRLRAIERTVGLFRSNNPNASLEDAKRAVLALLKP